VTLVDGLLDGHGEAVVLRLAPALDATLVVLELIHRVGAASVLALAPSHVRARALADRLRQAGVAVALLPDMWAEASTGDGAVVGTRAAAWAPLDRMRAAVVLDAHDEAYREERSPTWSAVDVVVERGRRHGAPVALVTACPPVVLAENRPLVTTTRPVERRGWPLVEVVDRTGDDPRTGLFSERLVQRLRSVLDEPGGRAVCILNRTGRLRLLACTHCGALVRCARCGGAMTQDEKDGPLRCRRGDEARPPVCAVCDGTRLRTLRMGVRRATEELAALTQTEAVEITAGSEPGQSDGAPLVVGTEAALHRQSWADLVAFVDIDQHLLAPRFGAGEETLALLARAARLVGSRRGRLLVQTRLPDHEALRAAVVADPTVLAQVERPLRQTLELPPFGALATVGGPGAAALAEGIGTAGGVAVSSLGDGRWLVRAGDHQRLCDRLAAVPRPAQRVRVEVDPVDV
jgi:primosomal protein N' (replication factor Y)